jgi:lipid-binding SYLF domain-containing protein
MHILRTVSVSLILPVLTQCSSLKPEGSTAEEQREFIDARTAEAVERLEKENPEARGELASSEGYAVFRYSSGKLPLILTGLGAGSGYGLAVDSLDDSRTYMKVRKYNWGFGTGVRENSVIFAFSERDAFEKFRSGQWTSGGGAEATAKTDDAGMGVGGTASVKTGYKAWTLTEAGLSYGITYEAMRYSPVSALDQAD